MAYRVTTVKDGKVTEVRGNTRSRKRKSSTLDVGVFGQSSSGWPMWSDAAGVHPDQIPEMMEFDRSCGISVEYRDDGCVKFNDRSERAKYCSAHALVDRNGGYSDPQPGGYEKYDRGYDSEDASGTEEADG